MRRIAPAGAAFALFVAAPSAGASVYLGVAGNPARFDSLTSQRTQIRHVFMSFAQGSELPQIVAKLSPIPMLALNTGSYGSGEIATPRGIAEGRHDTFLFRLNAIVASWPGPLFYLRPFPEMNAWWTGTCAYNRDGSRRGGAHATRWARKAFARIAVVVRGGARADVNAQLARLGLPGIDRDLPVTVPKLRLVWNPQGFGAPDVPGNSAQAYYPGDAYVDVVGDDLYDMPGHGATWSAAQALYRAHPSKPFAFPEWGLWGFDDPQYVRDMARWIKTHVRTELIAYYAGRPGSVFDLLSKPRSRAVYRALIAPLGRLLPPSQTTP